MTENKDWLEEWKKMMCAKMHSRSGMYWDDDIRCETPDGIVTCDECRFKEGQSNEHKTDFQQQSAELEDSC